VYTGIVEELGSIAERDGSRVRIHAKTVLDGVAIGDSLAVNGCCLTVVAFGDDWWDADLSEETCERSTLGELAADAPVNLERPLRLDTRLGGHMVQGHVDGIGEIVEPALDLRVRVPVDLMRYMVVKGSVTVDGVSLTIVDLFDDGFTVALIPHTAAVTTLGMRQRGEKVNIEVDVIAKYVERLTAAHVT
jgi:riboflavin synthase